MWKFTFVVFILLPPTSCFPLDVNSLNVNQFFLCTIFVCNNLKFPSYLADSFVLYYSTLCLLALLLCTTFPNLIYWCWTVPFFHWLFDERWKRYREWNMFCLISNWVRFHQIEKIKAIIIPYFSRRLWELEYTNNKSRLLWLSFFNGFY